MHASPTSKAWCWGCCLAMAFAAHCSCRCQIKVGLGEPHVERGAQELAWASYALLRNTNASAVLLVRGGRAWLARGAVSAAAAGAADGPAALDALGQAR